jgi:hypothetical protein
MSKDKKNEKEKFNEGMEILLGRIELMLKKAIKEGKYFDMEFHGNEEETKLIAKWEILESKDLKH